MFAAVDSVPEGHENKTLLHQCADELGLPPGKVNGEVVWDDQKVNSPKFISLGALYPSKSGLMNKHIVKHISLE